MGVARLDDTLVQHLIDQLFHFGFLVVSVVKRVDIDGFGAKSKVNPVIDDLKRRETG